MALNYVKFQRGTLNAYRNLRNKDSNTLYFIYADEHNQYGSLYLGDKLISGGEVSVISSALSDLTDISLNNLQDNQILVYDSANHIWKNSDLATVLENANIEIGGSSVTISNIKLEDGETDEDGLETILNPSAGDIAFIGDNIYIYDGEEWHLINNPDPELLIRIDKLEQFVGKPATSGNPASGLFAELDEKIDETRANELINTAITNLNSLTYKRVNSVQDINLSETQYIYLVPVNLSSSDNKYDEYLVIDDELECIGHLGGSATNIGDIEGLSAALSGKANNSDLVALETRVGNLEDILNDNEIAGETVPGLVSVVSNLQNNLSDLSDSVGNLTDLIDYDSSNPTNIIQEINLLKQTMSWIDIDE